MNNKISAYINELLLWNEKFNLTAITDPAEIQLKHIDDSLSLEQAFDFRSGHPKMIDIGTGAGLPGIPLKIKYPNIKLTLLDAVKKKTDFLEHVTGLLGLEDVDVIWGRAEELSKTGSPFRESYDIAVCRALADLAVAAEWCLPFLKVGGEFIAMKSAEADNEIEAAGHAIKELGGALSRTVSVQIGPHSRKLVVISKLEHTPVKFPRKAGIARKRPIK